jgi:peptidoglycan/xylan/chitin deacetylase (PgdA/CDA1 family)
VTLDEIVQFVAEGKPLPRWAVAVTFDDGFTDNHEVVLPILQKYGVPAMFYIMVNAVASGIPPWYVRLTFAFHSTVQPVWIHPKTAKPYQLDQSGQRSEGLSAAWDLGAALAGEAQEGFIAEVHKSLQVSPLDACSKLMMDWDQVRALKRAGHSIGGHTLSHPNLAHVPLKEARSEIRGCKEELEKQVGEPIHHFSYPHPALSPQWSAETREVTRETGFQSAVLTTPGSVRPGDEPLALARIPVDEDCQSWLWQVERAFTGL